jgi:hypothetical protein
VRSLVLVLAATLTACELVDDLAGDDENASSPPTAESPNTTCAGAADTAPDDLACTGLYADFGAKTIAPRAKAYAPGAVLWSDGAEKARFIDLPDGARIDAHDPSKWKMPVGTKAWKEFKVDGRLVETRFFWKVRDDRWVAASYAWSPDGAKATRHDGGPIDLGGGRTYAIPSSSECNDCHKGAGDRLLGFEPVSLALPNASGFRLAEIVREGRIDPPPARTDLPAIDAALPWLHANCGGCHTESSNATAYSTGLRLRLRWDELDGKPLEQWSLFTSSVGVGAKTPAWIDEPRIVPGNPEASLVVKLARMRGEGQMPPIASNVVDEPGLGSVETWIRSLPH